PLTLLLLPRAPRSPLFPYTTLFRSYVSLTWLPSVEQGLGVSPVAAGWHMFLLQIAGVVGNLAAPVLMRIGRDQQFAAVLPGLLLDRKSTRLNSSHVSISYAVFCLKK